MLLKPGISSILQIKFFLTKKLFSSSSMASADKEKKKKNVVDCIKSYPDFPKKGVNFMDIFPIMRNPEAFKDCIDLFTTEIKERYPHVEIAVGLESRGFLFAPIIAQQLNISFVPIRKAGKLPSEKFSVSYDSEYGKDTAELAKDSISPGQRVIIIDDLLATGGTMKAAVQLIDKSGGKIEACMVLLELTSLQGRKKLDCPVFSIHQVDGN